MKTWRFLSGLPGKKERKKPMKPGSRKRQRLWLVLIGGASVACAAALALTLFRDNLMFFYSPTDIWEKKPSIDRRIRVGGLVKEGSVVRKALATTFIITDLAHDLTVRYQGLLPPMFREKQGVVANGALGGDGVFVADELLTKHDENYMPPEVADALKRSGEWKGKKP